VIDRFTDAAKKSMNLARQAAQRLRHDYLGTEHILYGLLEVDDPPTQSVFSGLHVDPADVRGELDRLVQAGPGGEDRGQISFTPRAKKVLELAMTSAGKLGDNHLGTEHLLLGLIQEGEGLGSQVLKSFDMTWENVAGVLNKSRGRSASSPAPASAPAGQLDEAEAEAVLRIAKRVLERRGEWSAARALDDVISRFRLDP
jgi:ATP-dependent Clp protease ATP-binding subunit ClpC